MLHHLGAIKSVQNVVAMQPIAAGIFLSGPKSLIKAQANIGLPNHACCLDIIKAVI